MANIYIARSDLATHATGVTRTCVTPQGRQAIAVAENILRPAGGGQPQDRGTLETPGGVVGVGRIFKEDGETWIELDGPPIGPLEPGDAVVQRLDATRRHNLSRCHSLTHLGMAMVREALDEYESKGAQIADNAADVTLFFRAERLFDQVDLQRIDRRMRTLIHQAVPIRAERARSLQAAESQYPAFRADPDNQLSGKVRIIHIEGIDANPCSGSHVSSTAEIGPFSIGDCRLNGAAVVQLSLRRLDTWMSW